MTTPQQKTRGHVENIVEAFRIFDPSSSGVVDVAYALLLLIMK